MTVTGAGAARCSAGAAWVGMTAACHGYRSAEYGDQG
jgi:hypothetical protein